MELGVLAIKKIVEKFDETKAVRPYGVSPFMLRHCAALFSLDLFVIFTQPLGAGELANDWKIAHVVPIHNGDSRKQVQNYRPISLTCVMCKVTEHIIYAAIMNHIAENNIVLKEQHGFRKGRSCAT